MTDVFIAAARRSPIAKLNGALADLSAADIGGQVIAGMLADCDVDPALVDDVILGQVLTGGAGQNPARQASLAAGLANNVPAMTMNMVCGAGQRSIHIAAQAIKAGDAGLIVAGGQDSMTNAPHFFDARNPVRIGHFAGRDMMITDGLWDAFNDVHMGDTAEHLAHQYGITREEQDHFAIASQQKAGGAIAAGLFAGEIVPIRTGAGNDTVVFGADEHPKPDTTLAKLSGMPPVFGGAGTITAGNASGLNDGAAAVLVGSRAGLHNAGLDPLVRVAAYASAALDPMDMGLGPAVASRAALSKAGWTVGDLDILEINEAFAAQAIAVNRNMGWDPDRINPNGGAIALGHPLAGSGARIVVTLIHEMVRRDARRGLASLCIGGGQGVAICLERN